MNQRIVRLHLACSKSPNWEEDEGRDLNMQRLGGETTAHPLERV